MKRTCLNTKKTETTRQEAEEGDEEEPLEESQAKAQGKWVRR